MTWLQIYAFFVLPFAITAGGCVYYYLWSRDFDRKHGKPPAE